MSAPLNATISGLKILVVDDNRDAAMTLGMLFKMSGNEIQTAHDGEQALERAVAFRPNVLIVDIGLPKLSGYEVCRSLREHAWGRSMTMIAMTGRGDVDAQLKSREAGFNGHLTKPVDFRDLTKFLGRLLSDPNLEFQV